MRMHTRFGEVVEHLGHYTSTIPPPCRFEKQVDFNINYQICDERNKTWPLASSYKLTPVRSKGENNRRNPLTLKRRPYSEASLHSTRQNSIDPLSTSRISTAMVGFDTVS
ncbi:hypothetical protein Bca4012_068326 [Brassica carinata]